MSINANKIEINWMNNIDQFSFKHIGFKINTFKTLCTCVTAVKKLFKQFF